MKTLIIFAALATAIASPALARPAHQTANSESVISGSQYLGSDPDANVRFDLSREIRYPERQLLISRSVGPLESPGPRPGASSSAQVRHAGVTKLTYDPWRSPYIRRRGTRT